jgi:hypothetical protein
MWEEQRILPHLFFEQCQKISPANPQYGNGFWHNRERRLISGAPEDTYFMNGYRSNRCYVLPSLDMVVARCGTGPAQWPESKMLGEIVAAIG